MGPEAAAEVAEEEKQEAVVLAEAAAEGAPVLEYRQLLISGGMMRMTTQNYKM